MVCVAVERFCFLLFSVVSDRGHNIRTNVAIYFFPNDKQFAIHSILPYPGTLGPGTARNSDTTRTQNTHASHVFLSTLDIVSKILTNNSLRTSLLKSMHNLQLHPQGKGNSLSSPFVLTQQLGLHFSLPG